MGRIYHRFDEAFVEETGERQYIPGFGAGAVHESEGGQAEVSWVQDGNTLTATTVLSIAAASTISQTDSYTIEATLAGLAVVKQYAGLDGWWLDDAATRSFMLLDGGGAQANDALVANDRTGQVSITQAGDSTNPNFTVSVGATSSVGCTVDYTQASNTVTATTLPYLLASLVAAQDTHTAAGTQEVKRILLSASGMLVETLQFVANQDSHTTTAQARIGDYAVVYTQDSNTSAATVTVGAVQLSGSPNTQGDSVTATGFVPEVTTRTVALDFRRRDGSVPLTTTFTYAFWDDPTPDLLDVATQTGIGNIDSNGQARINIFNSSLLPGEVGYIVMSDTDGNPDVPWRHHSGPVKVQ